MIYEEITGDVMGAPKHFHIAHCIDTTCAFGSSHTKLNRHTVSYQINQKYATKAKLLSKYTEKERTSPTCIKSGRIINLITKRFFHALPTMESITATIQMMKELCIAEGIKHIAMPRIGCGTDGLDWLYVSKIVRGIFEDTDIHIIAYLLDVESIE